VTHSLPTLQKGKHIWRCSQAFLTSKLEGSKLSLSGRRGHTRLCGRREADFKDVDARSDESEARDGLQTVHQTTHSASVYDYK
jgi:hypothetical protein